MGLVPNFLMQKNCNRLMYGFTLAYLLPSAEAAVMGLVCIRDNYANGLKQSLGRTGELQKC